MNQDVWESLYLNAPEKSPPVVYVVQEPLMKDRVSGKPRPKFDLTPAQKFGVVRCLLPWSYEFSDPARVVWDLRKQLKGFTGRDFLLMTGDPNAMAIAACIACEMNDGRARLLSWDNVDREYAEFTMDMNAQPPL